KYTSSLGMHFIITYFCESCQSNMYLNFEKSYFFRLRAVDFLATEPPIYFSLLFFTNILYFIFYLLLIESLFTNASHFSRILSRIALLRDNSCIFLIHFVTNHAYS